MTKSDIGRRVLLIGFDGMQALDLVGPHEVFAAANALARSPSYRVGIAATRTSIRTESGLTMEARSLAGVRGPLDTMLIAGGLGAVPSRVRRGATKTPAAASDLELLRHVSRLARSARRIGSVCTGAFVLAAAGLLDGRKATTHWSAAELLAKRFPNVHVDPAPIYLHDDGVWTSAGVTAGIDLALAMVADDLGSDLANEIARWLVLSGRRGGLQSQYNPRLASVGDDADVAVLVEWIGANLNANLSVATLAVRANLSERQLNRRFERALGVGPAAHVENARLDACRQMLERSKTDVASIARRCGFGSRESLHRAFVRRFGITPAAYRQSFGGVAGT